MISDYIDDLIIYGKTIEEHSAALERVLQRLLDNEWATVQSHKMQSRYFLWLYLAQFRYESLWKKLKCNTEMDYSKTGEDLRSFLGMATYLGSTNIPHFSILVDPVEHA